MPEEQAEHYQRLQSVALEAAADAIAITDRNGRVEWVNSAFGTLTGYTREEATGKTLRDLLRSGHHPPEFFRNLWETILAGKVWSGEVTNRRKDGSLFAELLTITPLREYAKEITHFVAIKHDVSERRRLEAQLLRAQRLESVGRLAGGVAHDLNNILSPVMMGAALLRTAELTPGERELLTMIEQSAQRGAKIIRQLLTFSQGIEGEHVPVQIGQVVDDMLAIIKQTFPKNIAVRCERTADPGHVEGDSTQMHQVVMNLCINARDAMPQGGLLTIGWEGVEATESFIRQNPDAAPGTYVVLSVSDTGMGIAPEHLERIFDPFFTTKDVGKGTGLGLSTVLGIVKGHGGFVQVQSKLDQGTSFRVYLPARLATPPAASRRDDRPAAGGRGELVLVIDDEDCVRTVLRLTLEGAGYRVIEAANGADGIAQFERAESEIKLVITDLFMGGIDGAVVAGALRERNSTLPIIAISGAWQAVKLNELKALGVSVFLNKPFSDDVVLRAVAEELATAENRATFDSAVHVGAA